MSPSSRQLSYALPLVSLLAAIAHAAPAADSMDLALEKRLTQTYSGCYSSSDGLTSVNTYTYQSTGWCGTQCANNGNTAVLGLTNGADCWCGNELPPASAKVDESNCNVNCTGFGQVMCGGVNAWSVYLTGTEANVPQAGASSSASSKSSPSPTPTPSSSSTTTDAPSTTEQLQNVVTSVAPGTTIVVTQPADQSATETPSAKKKGGSNTAGIAAGVVVGVVALAAIVGALFFLLRRRRQRQAEEDYKRSTQVNAFMRGTDERKPPGTSYSQSSDTRLDPVFGARRNSVGSMADSQDYSRRILRVANPDGN